MLPFVIHADWLDITELWIAESEQNIANTIVGLDAERPFLSYHSLHHLETDKIFVVQPNITYVDYVDEIVSDPVLICSKKLCNPLDDFEAVTLVQPENTRAVDINHAIIQNRQNEAYVNCLDYLSSPTSTLLFKHYLEQELAPDKLISHQRKELQTCWAAECCAEKLLPKQPDNNHWDIETLMENQEKEAFAIICANDGKIHYVSDACKQLFGLPLDDAELANHTPADFGPSTQDGINSSSELMLAGARKCFIDGYNRISFKHHDHSGAEVECDIWQQRVGALSEMLILGHVRRAVPLHNKAAV